MKNRMFVYLAFGLGLVPLSLEAQDDMYFIPKKKTQQEKVRKPTDKKATDQETTYNFETGKKKSSLGYSFSYVDDTKQNGERDVDEYNRRYRPKDVSSDDESDYEYDEEDYGEEEGRWRNGFNGSDEDYRYAKRILVFRSPSVGIPVSSRLYWDLCYGPNSIYWNVYEDGFYAYALPTIWNRYYYSPWRVGFWYSNPYWSWHCNPYWDWHCHYPYYGPHYPHWHRPPYYGGVYRRPHSSYRTSRPSLGRTGVVRRGSSTGRYTIGNRRGDVQRGARTSPNRSDVLTPGRNPGRVNRSERVIRRERISTPRRSERTYRNERPSRVERPRRSESNYSSPRIERSTPMRSGGSFGGGSRGGGISRGGGSRGAR